MVDLIQWLGIISAAMTIIYFGYLFVVWCLKHHDLLTAFVHDGQGAPVTWVHLRLENGKIIEPDPAGICVIPKGNSGKLISVRDRKTGREIKVVAIPEIVKPIAPLEIVVAGVGTTP